MLRGLGSIPSSGDHEMPRWGRRPRDEFRASNLTTGAFGFSTDDRHDAAVGADRGRVAAGAARQCLRYRTSVLAEHAHYSGDIGGVRGETNRVSVVPYHLAHRHAAGNRGPARSGSRRPLTIEGGQCAETKRRLMADLNETEVALLLLGHIDRLSENAARMLADEKDLS